jgi:hypothetical protein
MSGNSLQQLGESGKKVGRKHKGGETRRELETKQEEQSNSKGVPRVLRVLRVPRVLKGRIDEKSGEHEGKTLRTTRGLEQSFRLGGGKHG